MKKERLYDAFGELFYALASVDGVISKEELRTIGEILDGHEGAKAIKWSFEYEKTKSRPLEEAFDKALSVVKVMASGDDLDFLIDALNKIAAADYVDEAESVMIEVFIGELNNHLANSED